MTELKPQSPDATKELEIPARFGVASEWALSAQEVANVTQDAKALQVWSFIDDRTSLGVPMPEGGIQYIFIKQPERPSNEYAYLTPILKSDIERLPEGDFRRKLAEGKTQLAAQYRERSQAIYLPPNSFGTFGKGVLMLHEGMHAWLDIEKKTGREGENAHWIEEANVFKFEFSLLSRLIGESYTELVSKIAATIRGIEDNPNRLMAHHEADESDGKLIANCLRTANDDETSFWLNVATQNAFYEYFKVHFDNPDTELASMLKTRQMNIVRSN